MTVGPGAGAMGPLDPDVLQIAGAVSRDLVAEGAQAVVLTGSRVHGDAHPESDVDLVSLGQGPEYRLQRSGGYLVAVSWRTPEAVRRAFATPSQAGTEVPGWRAAVLLHDPEGIAAALQEEARAWSWERVAPACDAWVADQVTGYAEEVHKLVAGRARGRLWAAAAWRSVLALRLASVLAVHHRILYGTENRLWDLVAERMGERWARAQAAALGTGGEGMDASCDAALELYALAAAEVWRLLDPRQRAVVAHACALAGRPPPDDGS